eukprot:4037849-Prymnesium_polylepis.1
MPGRTKKNARPANGSARQTTVNWGVRDGHWRRLAVRQLNIVGPEKQRSVAVDAEVRREGGGDPNREGRALACDRLAQR